MVAGEKTLAQPTEAELPSTAPLLAIVLIMVGGVSTLWPVLTPFARDLGAGGLGLGVTVGAIYATRLVLGPWIGRVADRYGYRGLLLFGTLLYIPIGLVYASAQSVAVLVLARLLHGVGSAIVLPMVMAVLGQHAQGRSGAVMARYNAAQWMGYAVGPLLGGLLIAEFGYRAVFVLLPPAGIVAALCVLAIDKRLTAAPSKSTTVSGTAKPKVDRAGRMLLAYNFVVAPASLIIMSFFPLLAEDRGYGPLLLGALLALTAFATAAVQPFWGRLADSSGVRPLLIAGGLGTLASLALLGALDLLVVAVVTTLTAGLFLAALVAGTSTAAVEAGRTRGMGAYMGLFASAGSAGQALMPLLFGLLLGQLGVDGLLIAVGVLVVLASAAYLVGMGVTHLEFRNVKNDNP